MTQHQLAAAAGVAQSTIGSLESGARLTARKIVAIAQALDVDALWLAEGKGSPTKSMATDHAGLKLLKVAVSDPDDPELIEIRKVKLKLRAGISGFATDPDDDEGQPITFRKSWLQKKGFFAEDLLAIKVKGQSMEPTFPEGATVVINTADKNMKDGVAFAFNYEGEAVIKRLQRDIGEWFLASDNQDQRSYPKKRCRGAECIVVGKIVHMQSDNF